MPHKPLSAAKFSPLFHLVISGFVGLLFTLFSAVSFGQNISGTINSYTEVTGITGSAFTVGSSANFTVGGMVLIIQMQGANINTTNSGNFGNINNINCAGCLEYNKVLSIAGNTITLENAPANAYNVTNGAVQLITVPVYPNPVITAPLTCDAWDGTTGGVLVFNACDTVVMNADIDVNGEGFRGGGFCSGGFSCATSTYGLNFVSVNSCSGGQKGEGITTTTNGISGGRGKRANGGGGSNPGNSGGGGGGNLGAGGIGGNVYSGCAPGNQGEGGLALSYTTTKAFMGGGGGGGFRDNFQTATAGGNGGGIVIISAPALVGNGNAILADGIDVTVNSNDEGAGAGGAGGTVLLNVDAVVGNLDVEVNGGDGGTTFNTIFSTNCHGPGGGGGGGLMWYKGATTPASLTTSFAGGAPGIVANPASSCFNTTFGAAAGAAGGTQVNLSLNTLGSSGVNLAVTPMSLTLCQGQSDTLVASGAFTYSWSPSTGLDTNMGSTVIASPSVTTTYTVTAISCADTATLDVVVTVNPAPVVQLTGVFNQYCVNDIPSNVTTTPSGGNLVGDGVNGMIYDPGLAGVGLDTVTYTVVAANGCSTIVQENIVINAIPNVTIINLAGAYCVDEPQALLSGAPTNGIFAGPGINGMGFTPSVATSGNHEITYTTSDTNGCAGSDTQMVVVNPLPPVSFTGLPNRMCLDDSTVTLMSTPIAGTFSGFGVTNIFFSPTTAGIGFHQISFEHTDQNGCTNSDTQIVEVKPLPITDFTGLNPTYCINNPTNELTPDQTGGIFSGPGIDGNFFDPREAGLGMHGIQYTYTDEFGCIGTKVHPTEVHPRPNVAFGGLDEDYCQDEVEIDLFGIPSGGTFTGAGISNAIFDASNAGEGVHEITYSFTDQNGCNSLMTRETNVHPNVEILFNENEFSYCIDTNPIQFSVSPQGGLWTSTGFENNRLFPEKIGEGLHVGRYVVKDENGCGAEKNKEFWIRPIPEIEVVEPADVFCNGNPVVLEADPFGGTFSGAGVENSIFDPIEAGGGKHQITYEYTDEFGCTNQSSFLIPGACQSIYAPNAFSPNGDGFNDYFLPKGENITFFRLSIFNRWGEMIFTSDDQTIGWDGRFEGKMSPKGAYFWKLEYRLGFEQAKTEVGNVTILSEARRL